jgi:STE24 endopeptidase
VLDAALLAALLPSGLGRSCADAVSRAVPFAPADTIAFVGILMAARSVLLLPLVFTSEVLHERRYGRRVPILRWAAGYVWQAVVLWAWLAGAALAVRAAAWWSPEGWWLWSAALLAAAIGGGAVLVPWLAARAAADVAPLPGQLSARLAALAARAGAGSLPVLAWKAARRGSGTAMLVGFGPARSILVADAVLQTHSDDEVEVIVAHELAHHHHGDAWWSAAFAVAAWTLGLYTAAWVLKAVGGPLGVSAAGDLAALPLVALVSGGVVAVLAPLANALSRAQERRADRDALRWTGNAPALVRTLKRLGAEHLVEDRPPLLAEILFHRHPGVLDRIAAAERWEGGKSQVTSHTSQTAGREPEAGSRKASGGAEVAGAPHRSLAQRGAQARAADDPPAAAQRAAGPPEGRSR